MKGKQRERTHGHTQKWGDCRAWWVVGGWRRWYREDKWEWKKYNKKPLRLRKPHSVEFCVSKSHQTITHRHARMCARTHTSPNRELFYYCVSPLAMLGGWELAKRTQCSFKPWASLSNVMTAAGWLIRAELDSDSASELVIIGPEREPDFGAAGTLPGPHCCAVLRVPPLFPGSVRKKEKSVPVRLYPRQPLADSFLLFFPWLSELTGDIIDYWWKQR